jgi:hypothetical protein
MELNINLRRPFELWMAKRDCSIYCLFVFSFPPACVLCTAPPQNEILNTKLGLYRLRPLCLPCTVKMPEHYSPMSCNYLKASNFNIRYRKELFILFLFLSSEWRHHFHTLFHMKYYSECIVVSFCQFYLLLLWPHLRYTWNTYIKRFLWKSHIILLQLL